jgi:ADP-heptose:LPS heptosyltransferase
MNQPFAGRECVTVRLSALGDAILTTGVLEHWRRQAGLSFHVLTRPALAPVFDRHPAVRRVLTVDEQDLRGLRWARFCRGLARTHGHMPLIDLHANLRTLVLRTLWPGPTRTYPKRSLTRRLFLTTRHPLFATLLGRENVPQRYSLALEDEAPAPALLRPRIFLGEDETDRARDTLSRLGLANPVAVHPYATHPAKSPAPEVWRAAIHEMQRRGREVLIIGRNASPLLPGSPMDLTNATDLRATAALIARCRCLITGDSGPMHLATGVDTPVIALFGPTTREWGFYPSGPRDIVHQIPCPDSPCSLHGQDACARGNACMRSVTAALLLDLLAALDSGNERAESLDAASKIY